MDPNDLARMRTDYPTAEPHDIASDPISLFDRWLDEALSAGIPEPNAMALATSNRYAEPSVRIVLLKGFDSDGAVFYTNFGSAKGIDVEQNPRSSPVMLWHPMHRQVRFTGAVTRVSDSEADAHFAGRPRCSQLRAAASPQSQVVSGRGELEERVHELNRRYGDDPIERPAEWGGFRIGVETMEFWEGGADRLHNRMRYLRVDGRWQRERLAP